MELDIKSTANRKIIDFRKYGFKDLLVLGRYNYNKLQNKLQSHVHKGMIEICYCDKGSQYFEVEGKQYLVKGGDVFIHFPGEVHGSGEHREEKGTLYWLIIRINKPGNSCLSSLCHYLIEKQQRHFKGGKAIKGKIEDIYNAVKKSSPPHIKKIRVQLLTQLFILGLLDLIDEEKQETDNERLNKILDYIDATIHSSITISSVAKEFNLSQSRFKILFKELTGFTPGDYIQRKKVAYAIEKMQAEPEISLSDIAYQLDFSSPQYFSTVMKKYTGKSPSMIKANFEKHIRKKIG